MRRIAFILDKMYRLATTAPFLYMATYFLYYIIPSVVDDRVRSEYVPIDTIVTRTLNQSRLMSVRMAFGGSCRYFPNVDSGQTAWTSLIGYLLGAIYFFVMIGVPRSRGYTAKAMAWNRPQIAVSAYYSFVYAIVYRTYIWRSLACWSVRRSK